MGVLYVSSEIAASNPFVIRIEQLNSKSLALSITIFNNSKPEDSNILENMKLLSGPIVHCFFHLILVSLFDVPSPEQAGASPDANLKDFVHCYAGPQPSRLSAIVFNGSTDSLVNCLMNDLWIFGALFIYIGCNAFIPRLCL